MTTTEQDADKGPSSPTEPLGFYVVACCESCGEDVHYGVCVSLLKHNGLPAIPFDIAAQSTFHCRECGASNYTGDFELYCEEVELADDDEPDE